MKGTLFVLLVLLTLVAPRVISQIGNPRSGMDSRAEAHLQFPDSSLIAEFSQDEYRGGNPFGHGQPVTLSARLGAHLATRAGLDEVVTWYGAWLVDHGWYRVVSSPATWRRGARELFVVSSDNDWYDATWRSHPPGRTGYYAIYYVTPGDCPGRTACPSSGLPAGIHY